MTGDKKAGQHDNRVDINDTKVYIDGLPANYIDRNDGCSKCQFCMRRYCEEPREKQQDEHCTPAINNQQMRNQTTGCGDTNTG